MTQLRSAGAKDYYSNGLSNPDYYLNDTEVSGSFNGRLAERIGINGLASKLAFDALCENINPITLKPLTPRKSKVRTAGYDLTFCCPKSVSLLYAFADDDHILNAFRSAVHDTMKAIEADALTRVRKNGKDENRTTGELLYTDFIHQTARAVNGALPDPFLHCHCYTFNATYDPVEKQYKAMQFRNIMRDMPFYEAIFHKHLADNIKALGYQIRPTKNSFEVVGIKQETIDLFSKRKNEIEKFAKEHDITDEKQRDKLGARTRAKKQKGLSMDALNAEWKKQIEALGQSADYSRLRASDNVGTSIKTPAHCIDQAVLHSFERNSVIQDRRLLAKAYKLALGEPVSIDEIEHCFKTHPAIIKVQKNDRVLCTTKAIHQEETRLISLAHAGKGMFEPLYSAVPLKSLEGEQAKAARHVLTTDNQVSVIMGGAGTGKTTLMKETVALFKEAGKEIVILAPTALAARDVLRKEGFSDAETVTKFLTSPLLQKRLKNQVLWVDEAGLSGTKDLTALLEIAYKQNARVILSGDIQQHRSVAYGDGLRLLVNSGIQSVGVSKIYRQRKKDYRKAVEDLAKGNIKSAFGKIEKMGAIKAIGDDYQSLAKDYITAIDKNKSVLAVSPTHAEVEAVTAVLRNALRKSGKIGERENTVERLVRLNLTEAEKIDARFYEVGQALQFNQNCKNINRSETLSVVEITGDNLVLAGANKKRFSLPLQELTGFDVYRKAALSLSEGDLIKVTRNGFDTNRKSLNNGQILKVISFNGDTITARHPDGKSEFHLPVSFGHWSHGYCMTSHASQGQTVDEVFIIQPSSTFPASDMKKFYVSCSRGRDALHIYTDNKKALLNQVSRSGDRMSAIELLKRFPLFTFC